MSLKRFSCLFLLSVQLVSPHSPPTEAFLPPSPPATQACFISTRGWRGDLLSTTSSAHMAPSRGGATDCPASSSVTFITSKCVILQLTVENVEGVATCAPGAKGFRCMLVLISFIENFHFGKSCPKHLCSININNSSTSNSTETIN